MQTKSKIFDDLSQLMTNAMGVAQGAKDEANTAMKSLMDRWLADRDFVTREEFDAVRAMRKRPAKKTQVCWLASRPSKPRADPTLRLMGWSDWRLLRIENIPGERRRRGGRAPNRNRWLGRG